jgi:hypothetical protein
LSELDTVGLTGETRILSSECLPRACPVHRLLADRKPAVCDKTGRGLKMAAVPDYRSDLLERESVVLQVQAG